jgi:LacI family transcriptional regulator
LQESTELSRQALREGVIDVVMDSQPRHTATALVQLMVQLQGAEGFDPVRQRVYIPPHIVTSENL